MTLSIIAAITRDNALGLRGDLLYHISADLKRFKQLTMGHPIIMGRRTFESFPNGPLPGRRNIVVSRRADYSPAGAEVYGSLADALAAVADADTAYVIGGGEVYRQAMDLADRLDLTIIEANRPDADTFFPQIDPSEWRLDDPGTPATDPSSGVEYRFACFSRQ